MASATTSTKSLTIGEGGSAAAFAALAFLSLVIAAKAYTPEYAFHAYLFAAASVAAVFAIFNRYYDRPAELPPLMIDGKPNYNMGPVKFATVAAMFWGIAGFTVGLWAALRARLSGAQFRSAVDLVRPHPAAAHLGGDLRVRRQRAARDLVLRGAADLPRAARRRPRAVVRRARLQLLHRHRRHRLSARHHAVEGIRRARVVRRPLAHGGVGHLSAGLSRHASCGAPSRTSTSPTGSISPSSSPSRCCISATTPRSRCRCSRRSPTSSGPACRTRWCSGGTATTRSASSSPPASSPSCTTSSRSAPSARSTRYRLSIIHFWSLIFLYIWAGPHHLHYTALPDWAQTLGMTFSIILWMPSWGGMINGLMTLSGAWDKLRTDPVLRMMVVSVAFYGMATFEGPLMSIKVGQLAVPLHRLDHRPRAFRRARLGRLRVVRRDLLPGAVAVEPRALYSLKLVNWHFWISTIGIVVYISSMWVAGILQGLMWRAYTASASSNTRSSRPSRRCIPSMSSARSAGRCSSPARC